MSGERLTLGDLTAEHIGQIISFKHYRAVLKSVSHRRGDTSLRPITDATLIFADGDKLTATSVCGTSSGTVCTVEPERPNVLAAACVGVGKDDERTQ